MDDFTLALLIAFLWFNGLLFGYIIWAPLTRFKQNFIDGLSLRFLWDRKKKNEAK